MHKSGFTYRIDVVLVSTGSYNSTYYAVFILFYYKRNCFVWRQNIATKQKQIVWAEFV